MEVQEKYELPFESSFEWRSGLFEVLNDCFKESTIEVLKNYKKDFTDIEWKDDAGLLDLAAREGILDKIMEEYKKRLDDILF